MRNAELATTTHSPALPGNRSMTALGIDPRNATTHDPAPAADQLGGRRRGDGHRGDRRLEYGRGEPWDESYFHDREARRKRE